jgi:hypothetical protein
VKNTKLSISIVSRYVALENRVASQINSRHTRICVCLLSKNVQSISVRSTYTNQSFHVRLAFRFFGYEIRNRRIYNTYFLTLGSTHTKLKHHFHYNSLPTCLRLFTKCIDSEVSFDCSFYNNYKFSVARKMLCTRWQRNSLTS